MNRAGLLLPLFIAACSTLLRAGEPVTPPPAPASAESKSDQPAPPPALQASPVLPKDAPPATLEGARPAAPNPETLEPPKVTVTQKKRPRLTLTEEVMMKGRSFDEELARKNSSSLDRNVLNKFTLPAWTGAKSAADRAREDYELKKKQELIQDVLDLAKVTEVVDPAQAKAMRDAISKP